MISFDTTVLAAAMNAFGQPVTYLPAGGAQIPITGVFDRAYRQISGTDNGAGELTLRPVLGCRASSFTQVPAENEQFLIAGAYYVVAEVEDDGLGHYTIFLHGPI